MKKLYYFEYLYKIIIKLAEVTFLNQFPKPDMCMMCLDDDLEYDNMYTNQDCKHNPCICLDCNDKKTVIGSAKKGNMYMNSNYQCLGCMQFEPTGNIYIDEFNKKEVYNPVIKVDFVMNVGNHFKKNQLHVV